MSLILLQKSVFTLDEKHGLHFLIARWNWADHEKHDLHFLIARWNWADHSMMVTQSLHTWALCVNIIHVPKNKYQSTQYVTTDPSLFLHRPLYYPSANPLYFRLNPSTSHPLPVSSSSCCHHVVSSSPRRRLSSYCCRLVRKTMSEHRGVIYQWNQKGFHWKTGYSLEV